MFQLVLYTASPYNLVVDFEFDPAKDAKNIKERGISLALAPMLFDSLLDVVEDDRRDYGEKRFVAYGEIAGRLFVCVFTDREKVRRVISLRKANSRESKAYGL